MITKTLWEHVLDNIPGITQMAKYDNLNVMSTAFALQYFAQGLEAWTLDREQRSVSPSKEDPQEDPKPTT